VDLDSFLGVPAYMRLGRKVSKLDLALPLNPPFSDDVRECIGGRCWGVGRARSGYDTAGIVPSPMKPFSVRVASLDEGSSAASARDILRASSKSMRSLHWISSSFRLLSNSFSVSVLGFGLNTRVAWYSLT